MKSNKTLLVLDLDGTITKSDNLVRFTWYMLFNQKRIKYLYFFPLYILLRFKVIDNRKFKILFGKLILSNSDVQKLNNVVNEFILSKSFKAGFNIEVLDFIKKYEKAEMVLISANFEFLAEPIRSFLNINHQISIKLETKGNKYTGLTNGTIPYGNEKIPVLKNFVKDKDYSKTIGLADNKSDIPLLQFVDKGYLVELNRQTKKTDFKRV